MLRNDVNAVISLLSGEQALRDMVNPVPGSWRPQYIGRDQESGERQFASAR